MKNNYIIWIEIGTELWSASSNRCELTRCYFGWWAIVRAWFHLQKYPYRLAEIEKID